MPLSIDKTSSGWATRNADAQTLNQALLPKSARKTVFETKRTHERVHLLRTARRRFAECTSEQPLLSALNGLMMAAISGSTGSAVDFIGLNKEHRCSVLRHEDIAVEQHLHKLLAAHPQLLSRLRQGGLGVLAQITRVPANELRVGSLTVLPMTIRNKTCGHVMLYRPQGDLENLAEADQFVLEELVTLAGEAIDRLWLQQAANQAAELRDHFLSVASHELRTPLTALQLLLENLARTARKQKSATLERAVGEKLARAIKQTGRLARLVDNLLDTVSLRTKPMQLAPMLTEVGDFCRITLARWSHHAAVAGCDLRVQCGFTLKGMWDAYRMEQVFDHLLGNAVKYGAGRPISFTVDHDKNSIIVLVKDEGIGVAPSHAESIFEEFERAVSPKEFGGLGLGLYLSRSIVEAHGGHMDVMPAEGAGASFRIILPKATQAAIALSQANIQHNLLNP